LNSKQAMGCVLILVAIPLTYVITPLGGILVAVIGVLMLVLNTRFK
jgi:hypothetical protein